ncbi:hypothetical protein PP753_gp33 [Dinoroseobacter phage vB_DshP-R7L]|uniref:Uncharacterized protein n=1 Tax=Dinoroseobacter phage vB_DshP-R7L TaxID=2873349 RepID=A0AAE8XD38_9CAUD|nr:hypothetical protein PP753_gp33 [Dinoroseobacter phage vB_DshP-R7L]UAT28872.1 hypothetical protein R7L_gp33 [Dinoroseobacter phage vB_DshP-R7L]
MSKYHDYWSQNGQPSYADVAAHFGVNESTARRSIQLKESRLKSQEDAEQAILDGMEDLGFIGHPDSGWVKSQKPDKHGRTYSFRFNSKPDLEEEDRMQKIADRFTGTPPVLFKPPKLILTQRVKKAFISVNDLHSGALAWGAETGYGDWDLPIAMKRLEDWLCRLFDHVEKEGVQEIILYYNGDILHANGQVPMTATHGSDHILDVDSRHFKVVDTTGEQIIHTTDIAAQISDVRLVIKRGNHDGDSYMSLLQGAKWRYFNQPNVTVEMDPNAYWAHIFGKVAIFGHHGDRIKADRLVMQFLQRYRKEIADVDHITVWTGDKHHRKVEQFPGVIWEQASNWSEPDLYGSAYGETAMAQAVIYDEIEGETSRFTVKPSQIFGEDHG